MITKKYKVTSSRHDVREYTADQFEITAPDIESCDAEAIKKFKPHVDKESNAWNDMALKRIDVEPVIIDVITGGRIRALRKHNLPDDYAGILPRDGE